MAAFCKPSPGASCHPLPEGEGPDNSQSITFSAHLTSKRFTIRFATSFRGFTMKYGGVSLFALCLLTLTAAPGLAHHSIAAKFDEAKPVTLNGIVTLVDWKNPHVHV